MITSKKSKLINLYRFLKEVFRLKSLGTGMLQALPPSLLDVIPCHAHLHRRTFQSVALKPHCLLTRCCRHPLVGRPLVYRVVTLVSDAVDLCRVFWDGNFMRMSASSVYRGCGGWHGIS